MLRDELTQLTSHSKTVTGFRHPRACRIRKYQFEKLIQIHKMWLNWHQLTDFQTFSAIFMFFRSWNTSNFRTITFKNDF
jgi:hypothetical protein